MSFEKNPNEGTRRAWVRPDSATSTTFVEPSLLLLAFPRPRLADFILVR